MARILDPAEVAASYRAEIRAEVAKLAQPLVLAGLLSTDHGPSKTYAEYTRRACEDVGVRFDLRVVGKLEMEDAILAANADPGVHGMLVYYPIFATERDNYLRDLVDPAKDIEGLHSFWARCLYANRRFVDAGQRRKAILPCTPLAILKLIDAAAGGDSSAFRSKSTVTIFNRSEVVGRPLANMLANDGARVFSFDVDGLEIFTAASAGAHRVVESSLTRAEALRESDIVITGVPSRAFPLVQASEIKPGAFCLNFSTLKNFEDSVVEVAGTFVPRVGPMTVTMALRNTLRLFRNSLV